MNHHSMMLEEGILRVTSMRALESAILELEIRQREITLFQCVSKNAFSFVFLTCLSVDKRRWHWAENSGEDLTSHNFLSWNYMLNCSMKLTVKKKTCMLSICIGSGETMQKIHPGDDIQAWCETKSNIILTNSWAYDNNVWHMLQDVCMISQKRPG